MFKTRIKVSLVVPGLHLWKDNTTFLGKEHRHLFKITAISRLLNHDDREIEFFQLVKKIGAVLYEHYPIDQDLNDGLTLWFGGSSCEQIGKFLLTSIPEISMIEISEDGENSAIISRGEDELTS